MKRIVSRVIDVKLADVRLQWKWLSEYIELIILQVTDQLAVN
jgi:hypothetical protein